MGKRTNSVLLNKCSDIIEYPFRNWFDFDHKLIERNKVNLEWRNNGNLGDMLAPLIYEWMLGRQGLSSDSRSKKTCHLCTLGSLIGAGAFDAVVWGSGIHLFSSIHGLYKYRHIKKYDVRSVRGPITRQAMREYGVKCPPIYGDPAIVMPLIYRSEKTHIEWDCSLILHCKVDACQYENITCHCIDIKTNDYKFFIDEIKASKKIVSSSLHGIILAETYGVPAVFYNSGDYVERALMKYYDWYFSTNRFNVKMANSIEEAIEMEPMPLPELDQMRKDIISVFPYDLWI